MRIEELKQKYKDEWVLVEVLEEDELNRPTNAKLIAHSKNRDDIYDKLSGVKSGKHVATFYTGEMPKKGYAVAFLWKNLKALEKRLQKGDISFILDHSDEINPCDIKRLFQYKNCVIYPPIAYVTDEAKVAKQEIFVENIENFLKGTPTNKVN